MKHAASVLIVLILAAAFLGLLYLAEAESMRKNHECGTPVQWEPCK